jgi:hypothetical protein
VCLLDASSEARQQPPAFDVGADQPRQPRAPAERAALFAALPGAKATSVA